MVKTLLPDCGWAEDWGLFPHRGHLLWEQALTHCAHLSVCRVVGLN